ncbi:hypothetical protein VNO77_39258 [Canavalia gladiata]|uniref:Secreted protein n=1 Tax=Canavalia gladiata TaxID=3824 RepID=A0AAN9KA56_CANGL
MTSSTTRPALSLVLSLTNLYQACSSVGMHPHANRFEDEPSVREFGRPPKVPSMQPFANFVPLTSLRYESIFHLHRNERRPVPYMSAWPNFVHMLALGCIKKEGFLAAESLHASVGGRISNESLLLPSLLLLPSRCIFGISRSLLVGVHPSVLSLILTFLPIM